MEFATVDTTQFPLIFIRVNPVNPTFEQIDGLFDELEAKLSKTTGSYVAITYAPQQFISSEARVRLGNHSRAFYERYKHRELTSILITGSRMAKIMLQTIQLLFRPFSQRQVIVGSEEEALTLAQKILDEHLTKGK